METPARLEIALKKEIFDPAGKSIKAKALDYFGFNIESVRKINVLTFDLPLTVSELETVAREIFTNPVTQVSSFSPLASDFDWILWIGFKPGVKDNSGDTAKEAVEFHFDRTFNDDEKIFSSSMYVIKSKSIDRKKVELIASELLANDLIQKWKVFSSEEWDNENGIGIVLPKVELNANGSFEELDIPDDEALAALSDARSLSLYPEDIPVIRAYFNSSDRISEREKVNLSSKPTDVELEFISQARSDHCNHNTFRGIFEYLDISTGNKRQIDDLFKTCIKEPTLAIQKEKDWVVSVLWDNAGAAELNADWLYTVTGETHNSPSNMEAYGGAITGIVGVYRDPMGTGLGSKLFLGTYGYCIGPLDYDGPLKPRLHPRRLLDGVIAGVKDGGNKSGIPTGFGLLQFDDRYIGKCLVYVTALGIMPKVSAGRNSWEKSPKPGDLVIMTGGRVGKDGIHGVTASSKEYSDKTPAGHVQIGDPYTQKKMMDFLLEVRDEGLHSFITDNGGGGLSSSIGESARMSGGAEIDLAKTPLKYPGLDLWEIWVSESQERMTIALPPENEKRFFELARKHDVEATVLGVYNNTGKLHLKYNDTTCAYVDVDFTDKGFPQWKFEAEWISPEQRGLSEPVITAISDWEGFFKDLLNEPNLAARNWIIRQYDHEVQGGSVIKPLCGINADVPADATVYRPVLDSMAGLAISQCLNPDYGDIDTYHMTAVTLDEAIRRLVAAGVDPDRIGAVDNFCWPTIIYDEQTNPDGKYKAAQLVRSAEALKDICLAYGVPLLSGKDSMYVDGLLEGPYGERHKISGPPSLMITATGNIDDIKICTTIEPKNAGDLLYVIGSTYNELGGSAYYRFFGQTGLNVPKLDPDKAMDSYKKLHQAVKSGLVCSAKTLNRGGLGIAAIMAGFASGLGLDIDLARILNGSNLTVEQALFSESCGRFLVSIKENDQKEFEEIMDGSFCSIAGQVKEDYKLTLRWSDRLIMDGSLTELKAAWLNRFGGLI